MRVSARNKRNYIIVGLCAIVMIMAVGFAAFSQQLQISSTSEVTSSWDIEITDIQGANPDGGDAYDVTPPTYTPTTATFSTGLVSPWNWNNYTGSYRVYQVEVSNLGTLTGQVSVASLSCGNNPAIECYAEEYDGKVIDSNGDWVDEYDDYIDIGEGQNTYSDIEFTLSPNEKHYIEIYVWYSENVVSQPANLSADISLTLNYVQHWQPTPFTGTKYAINIGALTLNEDKIQDIDTTYDSCAETGKHVCIKYTVINDLLTDAEACLVKNGTEYCLRGGVDECEWDATANNGNGACTYSGTPTIFNSNLSTIQPAFPEPDACESLFETIRGDRLHCITPYGGVDIYRGGVNYVYNNPTSGEFMCIIGIGNAACYPFID